MVKASRGEKLAAKAAEAAEKHLRELEEAKAKYAKALEMADGRFAASAKRNVPSLPLADLPTLRPHGKNTLTAQEFEVGQREKARKIGAAAYPGATAQQIETLEGLNTSPIMCYDSYMSN